MTPEQTSVIFEEYSAMNSTEESRAEGEQIPLENMDARIGQGEKSEPGLGARIRAELEEKIKHGRNV